MDERMKTLYKYYVKKMTLFTIKISNNQYIMTLDFT